MKNDNLKLMAPASDIDANTIILHIGNETEPII
jgi:hypothetical protein